jgi:hypothetical protein
LALTEFLNIVYWSAAVAVASLSALVVVWSVTWIVVIVRGLLDPDYIP